VVVFHSLNREQIRQIVDLMLNFVAKELADKNIKLEVSDPVKDYLGEKGYDEVFGARPLRRTIQNLVEDKLAEEVLRGKYVMGDTVVLDMVDGQISMSAKPKPEVAPADPPTPVEAGSAKS
jgi:ATP-dependent Clp protease ATP-binding subunit ClpC